MRFSLIHLLQKTFPLYVGCLTTKPLHLSVFPQHLFSVYPFSSILLCNIFLNLSCPSSLPSSFWEFLFYFLSSKTLVFCLHTILFCNLPSKVFILKFSPDTRLLVSTPIHGFISYSWFFLL